MKNLWNFFDGKKTAFGAVAMVITALLGLEVTEDQVAIVIENLSAITASIGVILGVFGVGHKAVKGAAK